MSNNIDYNRGYSTGHRKGFLDSNDLRICKLQREVKVLKSLVHELTKCITNIK